MFSKNWDRAEAEYLSPPDDDCEECDDCGGFGKISEKCQDCNGTGKIETGVVEPTGGARELARCEECEGTGTIHPSCDRCDGHGNISKNQLRREREEARGDYLYQVYKDRKAEGEP